ncbi:MAG: hypothetical protein RJA81_189 [Planctomycetota bacterium]|jgi:hypothetical protein
MSAYVSCGSGLCKASSIARMRVLARQTEIKWGKRSGMSDYGRLFTPPVPFS